MKAGNACASVGSGVPADRLNLEKLYLTRADILHHQPVCAGKETAARGDDSERRFATHYCKQSAFPHRGFPFSHFGGGQPESNPALMRRGYHAMHGRNFIFPCAMFEQAANKPSNICCTAATDGDIVI
jgi:hypothetical protein